MGEESKIERGAKKLVFDNLGIISSKLATPGDTGFPDCIFWLPGGKPLLVEFKRPGEDPRPKQIYQHTRLTGLGYQIQVHDNEIRTLQSIIKIVEASCVSKEGHEILARARSLCAVSRSRTR